MMTYLCPARRSPRIYSGTTRPEADPAIRSRSVRFKDPEQSKKQWAKWKAARQTSPCLVDTKLENSSCCWILMFLRFSLFFIHFY
ncbi:hypothetical protein BS78_08G067700 [Paspalum vaginatum]|nr:hypothetical protein BS78_08G067700 [Paspalum vaginatum]